MSIKRSVWLAAFLCFAEAPPPVQLTTQEDHKRVMDLLKITSLRRGADGRNPKHPTQLIMTSPRPIRFPICRIRWC